MDQVPLSFATPERAALKTLSTMPMEKSVALFPDCSDDESINNSQGTSPGFEWLPNNTPFTLSDRWGQFTIDQAWKAVVDKNLMATDEYKMLMCRLQCDECRSCGTMAVVIGDEKYDHDCRLSERWYDTQFIAGFCTLLDHDAHMKLKPIPRPTNDHRIMMVYCPYPKAEIKEVLAVRNNATHFVSVVFNQSHFAVLYYNLAGKTVSVFDGLNLKITNWQQHIIHTVQEYGLESVDVVPNCTYRLEKPQPSILGSVTKRMHLDITFGDGATPWKVTNERQYWQKDGFNCGPIAMLKLLEIYSWIQPGAIDTIANSPAGYTGVLQ